MTTSDRFPLLTVNFRFCVSVFLKSRTWLIKFNRRNALLWIR